MWYAKIEQMAAPTLASFLSFLLTVIGPIHQLCGQYVFLIYTSMLIFFFPRGRITQQLESLVVDFFAAVLGIAWSTAVLAVAAWCGTRYGTDSSQARAILGLGLAVLTVICGFVRSYAPRLNVACRAVLFYPIFLLTGEQTVTTFSASFFTNEFFVVLFAFGLALLSGIIFSFRTSSSNIGPLILDSIQTACDLLPTSLSAILEIESDELPRTPASIILHAPEQPSIGSVTTNQKELEERPPATQTRQQDLAKRLKTLVAKLKPAHAAYRHDILHTRYHPQTLLPILRVLRRLQRNPLLGPTGHVPGERIRTALGRSYATPASHLSSLPGTPWGRERTSSSREKRTVFSPNSPVSASQLRERLSEVATQARLSRSIRPAHNPARAKLMQSCGDVSNALVVALKSSALVLDSEYEWTACQSDSSVNPKGVENLEALKKNLNSALEEHQQRLKGIVNTHTDSEVPSQRRKIVIDDSIGSQLTKAVIFNDEYNPDDWLHDEDRFRIAFYMIALLDLAKDVIGLIDIALKMSETPKPPTKYWIVPKLIWPWGKETPEEELIDKEMWSTVDGQPPPDEKEFTHEYNNELGELDFVRQLLKGEPKPQPRDVRSLGDRINIAWRSIWDRNKVVRARVIVSRFIHDAKHSRHVLFSLKQAFGVCLLSIPAFLPPDNPGRKWFVDSRGAWMVISYMYVLEVTTGGTLRIAFFRALGTLIGAVVGFVCALIAHDNPYALVVLGTACSIPITYGILFTTVAPMAVVAGITIPPVMFITFIGNANGQSLFTLAWMRFVDIMIGIVAAVLIGTSLWPIHARVQYFLAVSGTLKQVTEYYLRMSRDNLRPSLVYQANSRFYNSLENNVRRNIEISRSFVDIQKQEVSLLPRPVKLYSEVIDCTERLLETFSEIRALRFGVPRKAMVLDLLPIRRELVSAVLVNLWACAQAFHTRSPLPQFLPSTRVPLMELMEAVDEHARRVRLQRKIRLYQSQFQCASQPIQTQTHVHGSGEKSSTGTLVEEDRMPTHISRPSTGESATETVKDSDTTRVAGGGGKREAQVEVEGDDSNMSELATFYSMAENEALGEICNILDELLAAARTLFGTQAFLDTKTFTTT